jgi:NDP-sugar pyrophosphorylase family protein
MMKRAVILAGGKGTRLAPYTLVFPKPLMPLGETPILEIVVRQLARRGFDEIILAVGHLAQLIASYFEDGERFGVPIRYVDEPTPLGTAGPLAGIEGLDEPFLVMNGDILTDLDYAAFLDGHSGSGAVASIATMERTYTIDFGVVHSEGGRVVSYAEKPTETYLVSMGVSALSPHVLSAIRPGERLDMPDLLLRLIAAGEFVRSVPFAGRWLDIGRHDDFADAQREFADHRGAFLEG